MSRGTDILIKNNLNYVVVSQYCDDIETNRIQVIDKSNKIDIINIYNPSPNNTTIDQRTMQLKESIGKLTPNTIITGDFNAKSYIWQNTSPDDINGQLVEKLLDHYD
ncbi:hypothetical protein JQN64_27605, partial [Escherichia coli]|nr:hypothetical protein [Escherichia coli]